MSNHIQIRDVSLRDGLQNERAHLTTDDKKWLLSNLTNAGVTSVELTSFVKPSAVPQMADADELMAYTRAQYPNLHAFGLIFNEQGYERALAAGGTAVSLVFIVSDALSKANSGRTADDWLSIYQKLIPRIRADGIWLRVYLAAAWVCPYEGQIPSSRSLHYAEALWQCGLDELCPTDVIGHAHPQQVGELMTHLVARYGADKLAIHLHDTQALALANAYSAIQAGIRVIDASIGGLGGCPFAPGSAGNVATEDIVFLAHKMGYHTGIDAHALARISEQLGLKIGRPLGGRTPHP